MRLLWRLLRWLLLGITLVAGAYFGGPYVLHGAGRYLISEDPPAKADLVLVLAGHPFLTVPEAARLYHEGLAPRILLTNPPREPGQEELLRVGIKYPSEQEMSRRLLEELRVPREAILELAERTPTLSAEAQAVAAFLRSRSERSLVAVAAKARSTRARMLLQPALRPGLALRMHPAPGDPYDPSRWWKEPRDRRVVGEEAVGLLVHWAKWAADLVWGHASLPQTAAR